VDLDYSPFSGAKGLSGRTPRSSILSFLEEQIQSAGRVAVVIHGDFGCGKTTTAKQFVANLAEDYLRGQTNLKVLYVDVNNIDIRARRDECLESELRQFNLTRDQTEALVLAVRADEIQLVFDGVDEMAKPVTTAGRREGLELLRDIGNRRTASYFIRSSYYLSLSELIADFANLADHDFAKDASKVVAAELRSLSQQQTMEYLDSRLDGDVVVAVRSGLKSLGLTSLLGDPLIVSYLADLVEDQGPEAVVGFQGAGQKAAFLSYLVEQLLEREQRKRQRQTNFAGGFSVFRKVLRRVAFDMVCSALSSLTPGQLTAFAQQAVSGQDAKEETVNAFRTMSWIHGAEDGRLAFRHEALTVVCAAQHVCVSLKSSDALSLRLWNPSAPLADVVVDYAANIASGRELLNAVGLLGGETILNVRQLAVTVLRSASGRQDLEKMDADQLDPASIAAIVRGMASNALVASTLAKLLLESAGQKQRIQIGLPLLYKLTQLESQEAFNLAVEVLTTLMESAKTFAQLLRDVKGDATRLVDLMVTKRLDIEQRDLVSILSYEPLFRRILLTHDADRRMRQQAERAMKAVENERSLLEKRQRRDRQRSR